MKNPAEQRGIFVQREDEKAGQLTPVVIGGYPRSGRTAVLHELQALGYEVFDDAGLEEIVWLFSGSWPSPPGVKAAVVIGNESGRLPAGLDVFFNNPEMRRFPFKLVFVEAGDAVLIERRPDGVSREEAEEQLKNNRESFESLRSGADLILNSAYILPRDEAGRIEALVEDRPYEAETVVEIMSFGFQYGSETGDLVIDVRFLPNPYYVNALRSLNGKDEPCAAYVLGFGDAKKTLRHLEELTETMVRAFRKQGRKLLKIRIGCTGGQHRSVALAEALAEKIKSLGCPIMIRHREMEARRY
jgi:UPF0042 nucleotide-binding protein